MKICRLRLASNLSDIKGADLRIDSDAVCEEEIIASLDLSFTNSKDILYAPQLRSKYTQKSTQTFITTESPWFRQLFDTANLSVEAEAE
jgi:hypothetical protein